jgi:spore germination cell wall hydrolase CwlJ-like protein
MSRKTHKASIVAVAATLMVTFAGAEGSGANAQQGENAEPAEVELTEEVMPTFVEEEVVQPLPAQDEQSPLETPQLEAGSLRELVAAIPTGGRLSREMECLAGAIYFESRGEPLEGQLAVGRVVINRAESDVFPSSYCGVVLQRKQFSFVRGGSMPSIPRSSATWKRAKAIARIAHEGLWDSEARDSLYFHAKYVKPAWSRRKVARASINTHIFYR